MLETRHPAEHRDLEPLMTVGSFADAAQHGELVVLAVRRQVVEDALEATGKHRLAGKIVIDTSSSLRFGARGPTADVPAEGSAGQRVAALLPNSRIVKAFNVVGAALMVEPTFAEGKLDMFICGNDEAAKLVVAGLCDDVGYTAFDVGAGRAKNHAFKLLRDGTPSAANDGVPSNSKPRTGAGSSD